MRRGEKSGDGLRRAEKRWSQLKRDEAKSRRTLRTEVKAVVFRGISYRHNLSVDSIAVPSLHLETSFGWLPGIYL